ncbi:ImmA/IrrE family metallo-endopeptidase [Bradyrhizobium sp. LLZ17]|uniref:ImmA/IrrE family metallo-endopeptidase n=1 Tax=Bradyrhizobium sp. LLZ17 TaxID=3239388 RepID=A0AB39XGJ4_9BRAD
MARLEEMSALEIGERLRTARNSAGKTQDDAANAIGVSRQTLISIEKGGRKVKPEELEHLAHFYDSSVNRLLARDAIHVDLNARFRRQGSEKRETSAAINTLNKLAASTVELERMLGIEFSPSYPPEQRILPGSIERQAEEAAMSLRHRLGVGLSPISDIVSLLEQELGIRVFIRPLPSEISGLFGYDPVVGACMVLNARHPWERRALTAAHETGHFVGSRSFVDVVELDESATTADERFATAFSLAFLMPPAAVRRKFQETIESDRRFTPRHLILMAHMFHVSPEAMCRQLERLELVPQGTFDSLRERGFNREFVRGVIGDVAPSSPNLPHNPRLAQLASSAYRRGLLSEGQLARMLDMDRVEVRHLLDAFGGGEGDEFAISLN